jgi:hypothetical protein
MLVGVADDVRVSDRLTLSTVGLVPRFGGHGDARARVPAREIPWRM